MNAIPHKLRQILVTGRDHDVPAGGYRLHGQRTQHIVGFNTFDLQQRPERFNLRSEILRHRRTVGLVLLKELVAEILPLGIKNADFAIGRHGLVHRAQHSVEALDGARRLALACGQRRQRVKGSEKVIGTVDKK